MSPFGALLRGVRLGKQLNLHQMSQQLGTTSARLKLIEIGQEFPPLTERKQWAHHLGFKDVLEFDTQWRDGWVRVTAAHRDGWIPIINRAPAGPPVDYEEFGIDSGIGYDYVPRRAGTSPHEVLFAVIILGNSMTPAYQPGDLVIFRPLRQDEIIPEGSAVFVRFSFERNHACTFKTYHRNDGLIALRPINLAHETFEVRPDQIDRMALAVERRERYLEPAGMVVVVSDEYAQDFPDE